MTDIVRFRCKNCGHRFETDVLDRDDEIEARRNNQPTSPVHYPKCNRTDALVVNPNLDLDGLAVEHDEEPERVQISRG